MHRYKKSDEISYTLGTELTLELLLRHAESVQTVYVSLRQQDNDISRQVLALCESRHIEVSRQEKAFKVLADKDNCYMIGVFRKFEAPLEKGTSHIVLVNPSNMGNLGTIIRTAVGFGITDLAIIAPAADIFDPKVIRASMGAFFNMRWQYFSTIEQYIQTVSQRPLFPFMLDGAVNLSTVAVPPCWSLVFGNEATGLPAEYQKLGQSVLINHLKTIDSLNLDNAVSIGLYVFTRTKFLP